MKNPLLYGVKICSGFVVSVASVTSVAVMAPVAIVAVVAIGFGTKIHLQINGNILPIILDFTT